MAEALEEALTCGSDESYDLFINYRVWCESWLANLLFKHASALTIGAVARRSKVYLDKVWQYLYLGTFLERADCELPEGPGSCAKLVLAVAVVVLSTVPASREPSG